MAGETSKRIGELGEELSTFFASTLGWTQLGRANLDIACQNSKHKSKAGGEKRQHGIDSIYMYSEPYGKPLDRVFQVEAKAITWADADGKPKTLSNKRSQLQGYLGELSEKINCARRSKEFREIYGLEGRSFALSGLIVFYIRDGFSESEFYSICKEASIPQSTDDLTIGVISNTTLDYFHTVFDDLEREALRLKGGEIRIEFHYPEFEGKKSRAPWLPFVTMDLLFSKFFVARVTSGETQKHFVYYLGSYSNDAIRALCAALGRFQILSLPGLTVVPLSLRDPISETSGLSQYLKKSNQLIVDGKEISVDLRAVTMRPLTLSYFSV